jgi:drug/metabolite transporter (DMT)-like permease
MAGGICEFMISLFVILTFNAALKANINQGIGTCLLTLNAIIVSILSYFIFGERITIMNLIGIIVILVALALIALFGPDKDAQIDILAPDFGQDAGKGGAMGLVIAFGAIAAVFSALEVICSKYMMEKFAVPGDLSGIVFQLFEGTIGTICLIILTVQGKGLYEFDSGLSLFIVILASICAFTSLTVLNYAVSVGVAGVAISIFNCSAAVHVVIASLFLG